MFIYTVRAATLRFFGVLCVALVTLITLIAFVPSLDDSANAAARSPGLQNTGCQIRQSQSAADAAEFLGQFGWKVKADPG